MVPVEEHVGAPGGAASRRRRRGGRPGSPAPHVLDAGVAQRRAVASAERRTSSGGKPEADMLGIRHRSTRVALPVIEPRVEIAQPASRTIPFIPHAQILTMARSAVPGDLNHSKRMPTSQPMQRCPRPCRGTGAAWSGVSVSTRGVTPQTQRRLDGVRLRLLDVRMLPLPRDADAHRVVGGAELHQVHALDRQHRRYVLHRRGLLVFLYGVCSSAAIQRSRRTADADFQQISAGRSVNCPVRWDCG